MPLDIYTKSLLHFNGADASTTFTDESGKVWTANGNAQLDTAQYVFTPSSGLFDGTGDYIDTPDSADFNLGSGDFTIDFRLRIAAYSSGTYVFGHGVDFSTSYGLSSGGIPFFYYTDEGTGSVSFQTSGALSLDTWYHIAIIRTGGFLSGFLDGVKYADQAIAVPLAYESSNFSIGRWGKFPSQCFNGWIDEFRLCKGIARSAMSGIPYGSDMQRIMMIGGE